MAATLVTGLVIEAIQKIASGCSGMVFARSRKPDGPQICDLAIARDRRNRAREGAGFDLRLLPGSDPRQPR